MRWYNFLISLALWAILLSPLAAQPVTNPSPAGIAGAYNSSPPTCSAGQFCFIQTDSAGNLKTAAGGVVGYDSGIISATATPVNSSHAAGTSIGGLFSVALARTAGGSGIITNFNYKSTGGSTGQLVARIWQKNPSSSTCTDNVAFVSSNTDDANLITSPFSITPAAPSVTTGDSATYISIQGVTWDYKNLDTTPGLNIYICLITVATDTADQNNSVRVQLSGPQN